MVDGAPPTSERVRAWQRNFGYVPQEIFLSDKSIRHKIAFGIPKNKVDGERIEQAARIASAGAPSTTTEVSSCPYRPPYYHRPGVVHT